LSVILTCGETGKVSVVAHERVRVPPTPSADRVAKRARGLRDGEGARPRTLLTCLRVPQEQLAASRPPPLEPEPDPSPSPSPTGARGRA
jgi:hypothetical protein